MQIDFSRPLQSYTGELLAEGDAPLTLRAVCCTAVTAVIPGETLTGHQKVERVQLARRIHEASGPIEVSVEEVALLRQLVNTVYLSPVLVAAAWSALDPRP